MNDIAATSAVFYGLVTSAAKNARHQTQKLLLFVNFRAMFRANTCFSTQLEVSPHSLERPTCVLAATRRCILVRKKKGTELCETYKTLCVSHSSICVCVCVCDTVAEKVTSLGKDWHRPCLRCERCSKTLSAGGHAEVRHSLKH